MAIVVKKDQILYSGKGPIDSKSLVKTYDELLDINTWTKQIDNADTFIAYNGMIVAVWLNKDDTSKNGLYFLYDPLVTTALKKPDVTLESNWIRLDQSTDVSDLILRLNTVEEELEEVSNSVDNLSFTKICGGNASGN